MMRGVIRIRRQIVRLSVALLLAAPVASAHAQDGQWWESIPGFGKGLPSYRTSSEEPRKPEVLNDLRPDRTPFRSEAMTFENLFVVPIGRDAQATEYEAVFT